MATKNNPGAYDCYANADPDEPMFVLLGRDKHAPTLVWLWAALRELDQEDPAKVKEAQQCMADMLTWQHKHGRKTIGVGHAALVGVMELIRGLNWAMKERGLLGENNVTTVDEMRAIMAVTLFEDEPETPNANITGR
jgi:hypothetical protein